MPKSFWTRHDQLWSQLVPTRGSAATVQGELIRATGRLADEAHRNGNINWDARHEAFCDLLLAWLSDPGVFSKREITSLRAAVKRARDYERPEVSGHGGALYLLAEMAVRWCDSKPEPIPIRTRRPRKPATKTATRSRRAAATSATPPAKTPRVPKPRAPRKPPAPKPGTKAARIADAQRFVTDRLYPSVRSDSRFDDVLAGGHVDGRGLVITGNVKSQADLARLEQLVERAAPPMKVHWSVRVAPR